MSERKEIRDLTQPLWEEFMDGVLENDDYEEYMDRRYKSELEASDNFYEWAESQY